MQPSFLKRHLFLFAMVFSFTIVLVSVLLLWGALEGLMEMGSHQKRTGVQASSVDSTTNHTPLPAGLEREGGACSAALWLRCEGWGTLCRNMVISSPRSIFWFVLQNLFTEESSIWILRLFPGGLRREARRGILGTLPAGAPLSEPAQTAPFSGAGRKEHFLFVNSSYAPRASFLPTPPPSSPSFGREVKSGQGSRVRSGQDSPPQPCWADFPGHQESPYKGTWSQI